MIALHQWEGYCSVFVLASEVITSPPLLRCSCRPGERTADTASHLAAGREDDVRRLIRAVQGVERVGCHKRGLNESGTRP